MKKNKAVELFAGIGGFRLAADTNGLKTIWANDVHESACSVYRSRFGSAELEQGDVRALTGNIPDHDILTAGFPCQPFSSAGKKSGIRDPRGTLFQAVVDVLVLRQPSYFVLENVKRLVEMERGVHFATILASLNAEGYDIEWRLLNSMHFGLAQNRQRIFIIGTHRRMRLPLQNSPAIKLAAEQDFSTVRPNILEGLANPRSWRSITQRGDGFHTWGLCTDGHYVGVDLNEFHDATEPSSLKSVLQESVDDGFDFTDVTLKWLHKNEPVNRYVDGVEILSNQAGGARMGYTIFGVNGVAPTLTASTSRHYERYKIGNRYRRLTNVEYARLQGFPDDHCAGISVYDQYFLYGNAVPPPMAAWVLSRALKPGFLPAEEVRNAQIALDWNTVDVGERTA
jgi:DNA (cytosine-5)-methyltransferase 1